MSDGPPAEAEQEEATETERGTGAQAEHGEALRAVPPSRLRGILNLGLFSVSLAICLPIYLVIYPLGRPIRRPFAGFWFRIATRSSGLRVRVIGSEVEDRPALLVANHVSYLDIPLLGGVTDAAFVSKADVKSWPLFGFLATVSNTVFIERVPARARAQKAELAARLMSGEPLILFAEGTSGRGDVVLPFKSALFGVGDALPADRPLIVQPMSVAYARLCDGRPLAGILRALYAWYGDMTLMPHLMAVMGLVGAEVEVTFHAPVRADAFASRKALAAHCEAQVAAGLARSLGLPGPDPARIPAAESYPEAAPGADLTA